MPIKSYKPTTPSRRAMTQSTFSEITTSTPEKSLLVSIKKTGGRNNTGAITCRLQQLKASILFLLQLLLKKQ